MTRHYPDLVSDASSDGISALVSQTSFGGETTSGSVANVGCFLRLIDTVIKCMLCTALSIVLRDPVNIKCTKILEAGTKQPWKM